jgi:hypothetical protein
MPASFPVLANAGSESGVTVLRLILATAAKGKLIDFALVVVGIMQT